MTEPSTVFTNFISDEGPTQEDRRITAQIEKCIREEFNLYETEEGDLKRQIVLGKIQELVNKWCEKVASTYDSSPGKPVCKIFTFGSFRLGVHGQGTDIDTLCVAPRFVKREDFFGTLLDMLKSMEEVTDLTPVENTKVPIIKMLYDNVDIDLAFARVGEKDISQLETLEDDLLKHCDEASVFSLNGCRVTNKIIELVPNIESFRLTLRCVRLWAKSRGIYSNVFGYLGGISWACLVCKICQAYPNLLPNRLLEHFFETYYTWTWDNEHPILLAELAENQELAESGNQSSQFNEWIPKMNPNDLFPIITPCFPSFNTSYNVSKTTRSIILNEFKKAKQIMTRFRMGEIPFGRLFKKLKFFKAYNQYLKIDLLTSEHADHNLLKGTFEVVLKQLTRQFEAAEAGTY